MSHNEPFVHKKSPKSRCKGLRAECSEALGNYFYKLKIIDFEKNANIIHTMIFLL